MFERVLCEEGVSVEVWTILYGYAHVCNSFGGGEERAIPGYISTIIWMLDLGFCPH